MSTIAIVSLYEMLDRVLSEKDEYVALVAKGMSPDMEKALKTAGFVESSGFFGSRRDNALAFRAALSSVLAMASTGHKQYAYKIKESKNDKPDKS